MASIRERIDNRYKHTERDILRTDDYFRVSSAIEEFLSDIPNKYPPGHISALSKNVRILGTSIDYDQYYEEWAYLYWLRNYWKAIYGLENNVRLDNVYSVLVLGSGSGADTAALLAVMKHKHAGRRLHITMVDRNARQQAFAREIVGIVQKTLNDGSLELQQETCNFTEWSPRGKLYDLVMVNHVLAENSQNIQHVLDKSLTAKSKHGSLFIIERDRDPVWMHAKELLTRNGFVVYDGPIDRNKLGVLLAPLGSKASQYLDMTPHYIVVNSKYFEEDGVNAGGAVGRT